MTDRIVFIAFDGFQLLDVAGAASVFGAANDQLDHAAYGLTIAAPKTGTVLSSCGVTLGCTAIAKIPTDSVDSLFLSGGDRVGLSAFIANDKARDWTVAASQAAKRFGSICSGSIILAAWGLIGDRRFATHWWSADYVRKTWPNLALDADSIFVEDRGLWTSAGVTTGIDMALAIVERDHGPAAARAIAQRLVLSVRRPGWQSQFSPILAAQGGPYENVIAWINDRLDQSISVEAIAERAGETLRSFHRNFATATGQSPAAFLTRQRVERARTLIDQGQPLKIVAKMTGFANVARLSAAFRKVVGMSATEYRVVHSGG